MKLITLFYSFIIVAIAACVPSSAFAQSSYNFDYTGDSFTDNGLEYKVLTDGTVTVVDPTYSLSGDVVIPSTVTNNGVTYTVSAIDSFGFGNSEITSVRLPSTITVIADYAFMGISATTIELPESLEVIGNMAFGSAQIASVTLPESLTAIDDYAFSGTKLVSVVIPDGVTKLGQYVFDMCYDLTSITFPAGIKSIPSYAASYLTNLAEIKIPEGIEEVQDYAITGCEAITHIDLPSTLKVVGTSAFEGVTLDELTIPANVMSLGQNAFGSYSSIPMRKLTIADCESELQIGYSPLGIRPIEEVYIGRDISSSLDFSYEATTKVTTGGYMTRLIDFNYGMPALTEVNLHEGLEYIGESAFYQSMLLTELTIPSTVTTIDKYALSEIYNLETLIFKDGDKPLEFSESPFTYTVPKTIYLGREVTGNRLTFDASLCDNITFGPGIREIDPVLFTEARNITEVNVLAVEPPVLDDASFPSVVYSRATLYTPDGSTRDYCDAHGWKLFDNIFGAEYVITVSHNEGGKVAVNGDYASAVAVGRNSTPVVTVTVDDGYTLTSMSLNGEAIDIESGEDGVYTLSAMRDDAVLDVVFSKESLVSSVVMEDVAVTTRGGTITVSNFDGDMTVVALDGKVLYDGPARTITVQAAGVYFVKVGDKVFKVAVD